MTRSRALKEVIRARAARTGERYTTARRHVLRELNPPTSKVDEPKGSSLQKTTTLVASTKGGLSDAKSIEKTGHDLAHWFAVLDTFGAVEKGHTKAADHLYSEYGVPGWYCQGITVAYERARGVRAMNQRCDGGYEVSVSKVMAAKPVEIIKALKSGRTWTDGVDAGLLKALASAIENKKSKGFVIRPDGQARFRYKWDATTVQFNMYPKGAKTSFVVQHMDLEGAESVEAFRAKWKTAFGAIADLFS
jgi:hypothetical protein